MARTLGAACALIFAGGCILDDPVGERRRGAPAPGVDRSVEGYERDPLTGETRYEKSIPLSDPDPVDEMFRGMGR